MVVTSNRVLFTEDSVKLENLFNLIVILALNNFLEFGSN